MNTHRSKKRIKQKTTSKEDENLQIFIEFEPVENKKIVVSAEQFNNFETMSLNRKLSSSSESSSNNVKSTIFLETNNIIDLENENAVDAGNGEPQKLLDTLKIDDKDKIVEGDVLSLESENVISSSVILNKNTSPVNRPIIITNLAGKKVSIIPKTKPVVLNNNTNEEIVPSEVNSVQLKPIRIIKSINKPIIKPIPNAAVMKITDVNKSQQFFNTPKDPKYCNLKIEKTESLAEPSKKIIFTTTKTLKPIKKPIYNQIKSVTNLTKKILAAKESQKSPKPVKCTVEHIDLTDEKPEKNKKEITDFSKILQVLTATETDDKDFMKEISKIPIYVDGQTQTDNLRVVKDQSVQTEASSPSPVPSFDELPNITNLLEYVLNTPKYSTGLDEEKKSDLIGMSRSIVLKGKMTQNPTNQDQLKKQLFLDLKDCATFDFLGNKPIHNAVLDNDIILLKRQIFALRLRRISLDIENNQGQTALQIAVIHNCNLELIYELLTNGASTNIQDNEGNTLVHLAVSNSTHTVLELLMTNLKEPLKEINRKNDEGLTALMMAAIDSKAEFVDLLLRSGADPNLRDEKSGRTALFHAVELNSNFVINLLLKYRADPKVRNYFGLTALDAAKDLDIADAKILEEEKDEKNHTSVIVNMTKCPEKRVLESNNSDAKKAKLNIVNTYKKADPKNCRKRGGGGNTNTTRKRKST